MSKNKWRLPKRWELVKAYEEEVEGLNSCFYWSSSENISNSSEAWFVYFSNGITYSNTKTDEYYVRCVKTTKKGKLKWKKSVGPLDWNEAVKYAESLN